VLEVLLQFQAILAELFLEQGVQYHCRCAGVFHPADVIDFFGQGRSRDDERRAELKTKIRG
jgi:hypothetical protein